MADGELAVRLDETLRRLTEAAAAAGEPIDAAEVLARSAGDHSFEEDLRLFEEYRASFVTSSLRMRCS